MLPACACVVMHGDRFPFALIVFRIFKQRSMVRMLMELGLGPQHYTNCNRKVPSSPGLSLVPQKIFVYRELTIGERNNCLWMLELLARTAYSRTATSSPEIFSHTRDFLNSMTMMRQNKILDRGASSPTQARLFHRSPSSHGSTISVWKYKAGERSKFRHRRAHLIRSYRSNWLEFFVACVELKVSCWRWDLLSFDRRWCSRERRQRAVAVE